MSVSRTRSVGVVRRLRFTPSSPPSIRDRVDQSTQVAAVTGLLRRTAHRVYGLPLEAARQGFPQRHPEEARCGYGVRIVAAGARG